MDEPSRRSQPVPTSSPIRNTFTQGSAPPPLTPNVIVISGPPAATAAAPAMIVKTSKPSMPDQQPATSATTRKAEKLTKPSTAPAKKPSRAEPPASSQQQSADAQTAAQHCRRIAGSLAPTAPVASKSRVARTKEPAPKGREIDPTSRRHTHPVPVYAPAVRPAQILERLSAKPSVEPSPEPRLMPHAVLYLQLDRNQQFSVNQITDRLATRHGWTDAERRLHRSRLDDIQQT